MLQAGNDMVLASAQTRRQGRTGTGFGTLFQEPSQGIQARTGQGAVAGPSPQPLSPAAGERGSGEGEGGSYKSLLVATVATGTLPK